MTSTLKCPRLLDTPYAEGYHSLLIENQHYDDPLILDFTEVGFAKPFATLLVAESIRTLVDLRSAAGLITHVHCPPSPDYGNANSYLMHIGFYKYIGVNLGNSPSFTCTSRSYTPITVITDADIASYGTYAHEAIRQESERLSRIIADSEEGNKMLAYCLRETIRNVFEHARIGRCSVLAQRWNGGRTELSIIDRGCGLFESLSARLRITTVDEALTECLKPGISRNPGTGKGSWENSGYGLYVLSQLGKNFGEFMIASQGRARRLDRTSDSLFDMPWQGTAIKLRLETVSAASFPQTLHEIIVRGEVAAQNIPGAIHSASKGSRSI